MKPAEVLQPWQVLARVAWVGIHVWLPYADHCDKAGLCHLTLHQKLWERIMMQWGLAPLGEVEVGTAANLEEK